MLLYFYR